MRKLILGLVGATALAFGTAAQADVTIDDTSFTAAGEVDNGVTFAIGYFDVGGADADFEEYLTFTETLAGNYGFTLTTTATTLNGAIVDATDVDFTGAWIEDELGNVVGTLFPDLDNDDVNEDFDLANLFLNAGTYTLFVTGSRGATSSFQGGISFAAVPEPGTWAMMLLGFGAVGFAMRRRRQPVLAQLA